MNKIYKIEGKGFTLIELLVVIALIGILSSILIVVINPVQQKNKAQDAVLRSGLAKVAAAAQAYYSAYGSYPPCLRLLGSTTNVPPVSGEIQNGTYVGSGNCNTSLNVFEFSLASSPMPATCDNTGYQGNGTTQCAIRYAYSPTSTPPYMYISARTWAAADTYFCWGWGTTPGGAQVDTFGKVRRSTSVICNLTVQFD